MIHLTHISIWKTKKKKESIHHEFIHLNRELLRSQPQKFLVTNTGIRQKMKKIAVNLVSPFFFFFLSPSLCRLCRRNILKEGIDIIRAKDGLEKNSFRMTVKQRILEILPWDAARHLYLLAESFLLFFFPCTMQENPCHQILFYNSVCVCVCLWIGVSFCSLIVVNSGVRCLHSGIT